MIGTWLQRAVPHLGADRVEPRHDGVLHLMEGRRGRGKSFSLMYYVREGIRQRVPIYANFSVERYRLAIQAKMAGHFDTVAAAMAWVQSNVHYVSTWDELMSAYDSLILLDEASRIFDSRSRGTIPPVALEWMQQSRKLRLTLVLASQSFDWLDVRIRQLADVLWMVRKGTARKIRTPTEIYLYGLDPWTHGLSDTVMRQRAEQLMVLPFRLTLAQCYNSWEIINLISGEPSWSTVRELEADLVARGIIPASAARRAQPGRAPVSTPTRGVS